jgi:hypothetical protein
MKSRLAPGMDGGDLVDLVGIEPTTSSMPWSRAPSCATGPRLQTKSRSPAVRDRGKYCHHFRAHYRDSQRATILQPSRDISQQETGEEKMIKTIILSMCLAASPLSLNVRAQDVNAGAKDERQYTEGPVTFVQEIAVEYGHFEEYIDWLNSTWKPTMEATKKAGIIIDYKVFSATPQSPDHPSIILWITYKNMAALDRGVEEEEIAKKVIGSTEVQNKARVGRNEYRKVLRREYVRELILK